MSASYQTHPFSRWRIVMADIYVVAKEKNFIHGLYEVDVTEARRCIHAYKTRTGDDFSFTAFLIGCITLAVDENKAVHALRWGKRLVVFDDVDVNIQVEHDVDGEKVVSTYVLRAANRKTMPQIHEEIRAAQRQKIRRRNPRAIPVSLAPVGNVSTTLFAPVPPPPRTQ
ncbi:MAG: 2-oxo acid dehydrogenase subunit E2 [Chloroflexota bacterium]